MQHGMTRLPNRMILFFARLVPIVGLLAHPVHAIDLLQAYRLGLVNDKDYSAARASHLAAIETLPQARAQLLPNVSFNASRNNNELTQETAGITRPPQKYESSTYNLVLRQPLIRPFQIAAYQQANRFLVQAEAQLEKDLKDFTIRLATAYFDVLLAQIGVDVIEAQISAYNNQLAAAKRAVELGTGVRTDADEAQARLDIANAQILEARNNEISARKALANIIGRPVDTLARLDDTKLVLRLPEPAALEHWQAQAVDANPELRVLGAALEVARIDRSKARSGHLPTLDLVAQRSKSMSDSAFFTNTENDIRSIGVQLNVPIFSGGGVNSLERQALAQIDRAQQKYDAGLLNLEYQLQKEFNAAVQGVSKIRALENALSSAKQVVLSTQKGQKAGIRTNIDVLNAEQQLAVTQRDLWTARVQYLLAGLRLKALAGILNEEDLSALNHSLK